MIKQSRRPFTLLKSRSRRLLSFDSTHNLPTPVGNQGSKLFSGVIRRSRYKNGPDEILIPVVGVSTPGLLCDHPLIVHCWEMYSDIMYSVLLILHKINVELLRGLVQSPCGKFNIIMTLKFYPPSPPPLLMSQHFNIDLTLKL